MEQILLTPKGIADAKQRATFSKYFWNEYGVTTAELMIAKSQLRNVMTEVPWKITTIGEERSVPNRTQIRFLLEDEYQTILKEAGLEK